MKVAIHILHQQSKLIKSFAKTICVLYSYQPLILLNLQLAIGSFSSQLNSVVAPLCELGLAHFLFHKLMRCDRNRRRQ